MSVTPTTTIEMIDAAAATAILQHNTSNRTVRLDHVAALMRDMIEGRWEFNADAIRIADDGTLIDGQHRLQAVVLSNVPIKTIVTRDLNRSVMTTIDKGKPRTSGDDCHINGMKNSNQIVATLRAMADYATGQERLTLSATELQDMLEIFPEVEECILKVTMTGLGTLRTPLSALHTINTILGRRERSQDFLNVMFSGIPDYTNDPAHAFRERYVREHSGGTKLSRVALFRSVAHAWNHFYANAPLKKFVIPTAKVYIAGWDMKALGMDLKRKSLQHKDLVQPQKPTDDKEASEAQLLLV